jgi:hypothetical protein
VGKILFASEESQEWTALLSVMIADRPTQHRIADFKSIKYRALRDRSLNLDRNLAPHMRERPQVLRKHDSDLMGTHLIYPESNFTIVTDAASPAVRHLNPS